MGYQVTQEDTEADVYTFLGVNLNRIDNSIVLSQQNKVLDTTELTECNPRHTLSTCDPLGTNAQGEPFNEK